MFVCLFSVCLFEFVAFIVSHFLLYHDRPSFTATKEDDEYIFIVMNSVFPAEGSKFISERYDLKGSTVGR